MENIYILLNKLNNDGWIASGKKMDDDDLNFEWKQFKKYTSIIDIVRVENFLKKYEWKLSYDDQWNVYRLVQIDRTGNEPNQYHRFVLIDDMVGWLLAIR